MSVSATPVDRAWAALQKSLKKSQGLGRAENKRVDSLSDRELIWELISRETEVVQEIQAAQARMMLLSRPLTAVCDRLDAGAIDALWETPEGRAWEKERDDA